MSDTGRFSRLRISDRGTQRMAREDSDLGSNADENLPHSSRVLTLMGVITWLRPVGKP